MFCSIHKEYQLDNLQFLSRYFALISHFKSLEISISMRLLKPKLGTKFLSPE
jgi:hypothetical protein